MSSYFSDSCLLSQASICVVALDPTTGKAVHTNAAFTQRLGPLYKFQEYAFWDAATTGESRDTLHAAIQKVMMSLSSDEENNNNNKDDIMVEEEDITSKNSRVVDSLCLYAVEMVTVCGDNSGLPRRRYFDWTIGTTKGGGSNDDDNNNNNANEKLILLFGTATASAEAIQSREVEAARKKKNEELEDFLNKAPIAMHWLSDAGIVLWANQTELDVLGYTAEEYFGQPIMNFCPDEQELVLEIFKQLGSGNTIRDVPVRFRTKDGRIVDLLIDSNVKYDNVKNADTGEVQKKFGHTRCFIRDDTSRKIRQARAQTLLQETKRSLQMLDNFSSRSIHHMRTPLHIMQNTCELVTEQLLQMDSASATAGGDVDKTSKIQTSECISLLRNAEEQIIKAVRLSDDLVQLGRLDQGAELVTNKSVIDLASWAGDVLYASFMSSGTTTTTGATTTKKEDRPAVSLEITPVIIGDSHDSDGCDGGPAKIYSDPSVLNRVLTALLEHARSVNDYKKRDVVTLRIGYQNGGLCTFEVIFKVDIRTASEDDGYSSSYSTTSSNQNFSAGKFPPIFQRYHQEYMPEDTMDVDFETASSLRQGIARHINSFKDNNLGISLSLAYFLVQGLGSELRYAYQPNGVTKFLFVLPQQELPDGVDDSKLLPKMLVFSSKDESTTPTTQEMNLEPVLSDKATTLSSVARGIPSHITAGSAVNLPTSLFAAPSHGDIKTTRKRRASFSHAAMSPIKVKREVPISIEVPKSQIACQGLKSMDPPHVLIVEDTDMCSKLLRMMLSKFQCTSDTVVNGRLALEKLRNAAPGEYNLVLMDLRMPVMDGLTATKILKKEMNLTVPIIALTAETSESIRTECKDIGFDGFHTKPLKRDALKDVLLKYTGYHVV